MIKGKRWAATIGVALFALAGLAPDLAQAGPSNAPTTEVVKKDPYYLSLHRPAGERPKATILAIPGGGWTDVSQPGEVESKMADWIPRLVGLGYQVATVGQRAGTLGLQDVLSAFDLVRRQFPRQQVCTLGGSSGGQLALMVAIDRGSQVACVVDHAGPPTLELPATAPNFWPFSFLQSAVTSTVREVTQLATAAFGAARLAELSPINHVAEFQAPVFIAAAPCDPYIPIKNQQNFASLLSDAGKWVQLFEFQAGNQAYASHCGVTMSSFVGYENAEDSFLTTFLHAPSPRRHPR